MESTLSSRCLQFFFFALVSKLRMTVLTSNLGFGSGLQLEKTKHFSRDKSCQDDVLIFLPLLVGIAAKSIDPTHLRKQPKYVGLYHEHLCRPDVHPVLRWGPENSIINTLLCLRFLGFPLPISSQSCARNRYNFHELFLTSYHGPES